MAGPGRGSAATGTAPGWGSGAGGMADSSGGMAQTRWNSSDTTQSAGWMMTLRMPVAKRNMMIR